MSSSLNTSQTKSSPIAPASLQQLTARPFGETETEDQGIADLQTQLSHAALFGHGLSTPQPIQRQSESDTDLDEEDETPIQAKLTIGQPNDKYEQEADQVAAKVMRMPEGELKEEDNTLQAKPNIQAKGGAPAVPANFENQLGQHKGGGRPLSDETRAYMEPRFGTDFSEVRVHETPDLANAIQAQAFTHGQDIYFNAGKYNPGLSEGKELLAHELTHTLQQSNVNIQLQDDSKRNKRNNFWTWYNSQKNLQGQAYVRERIKLEEAGYTFLTFIAIGTKSDGKLMMQRGFPGTNTLAHEVAWSIGIPGNTEWPSATTKDIVRICRKIKRRHIRKVNNKLNEASKESLETLESTLDSLKNSIMLSDETTKIIARLTERYQSEFSKLSKDEQEELANDMKESHRLFTTKKIAEDLKSTINAFEKRKILTPSKKRIDHQIEVWRANSNKNLLKLEKIDEDMKEILRKQKQFMQAKLKGLIFHWRIGRNEQIDFLIGQRSVKRLTNFKPSRDASGDLQQIPENLRSSKKDMLGVAPEVNDFLRELQNTTNISFAVGNYSPTSKEKHGAGQWKNKGFSVDLSLPNVKKDIRGFWDSEKVISFLLDLHKLVRQKRGNWQIQYNDYKVAEKFSALTGFRNVKFRGDGKNWHGPDSLKLHMHLDLQLPPPPSIEHSHL